MSNLTQVQSSVTQTAVIGQPGELYDMPQNCDIVSKQATAAVPFGTWVDFSAEEKAQNPTTTGHVTALPYGGIALRDPSFPTGTGYVLGDMMRVLVRGRAFVLADQTVVVTDTPFARFASGTGTQLGAIRKDADTATAVAAPNAKFFKGGGATTPPVLQLF